MRPEEYFYVGMDLGTFKTAVVGSNGRRSLVHSCVGFPRDHIARAQIDTDVIFGMEVMEKRMSLNVVRPFQRGELKYVSGSDSQLSSDTAAVHLAAARQLVNHAVSLLEPPPGMPIYGVVGVPSRAGVESKQNIIEAAEEAFDAVMVVPEPFCVAYGMDLLTNALLVDIGAGTTDLCPMYGAYPTEEDQVTVPVGGEAIDEAFLALIRQAVPQAQLSARMAREIKEKSGCVGQSDESVVATLRVDGRPEQLDVTAPLRQACEILVEPLLDGIHQVISRFDPEFQESLLQRVLLCGGASQLAGLDRVLETALKPYGNATVTRVHDSHFAGSAGALRLAMNSPQDHWQQLRSQSAPTILSHERAAA